MNLGDVTQPKINQNYEVNVFAIAREVFKKHFKETYLITEKCKILGIPPLRSIKIMTGAPYREDLIKCSLDTIYKTKIFASDRLPIDFYNIEFMSPENFWKPFAGLDTIPNSTLKCGYIDPTKAKTMSKQFSVWKEKMPSLTKDNVTLIDDMDCFLEGAKQEGFSTFHFATQADFRPDDMSFDDQYKGLERKFKEETEQMNSYLDQELKARGMETIRIKAHNEV